MNNTEFCSPTLINEIKNLISYSIINFNGDEKSDFSILHRAIVKKYFDAKNVKINYKEQTVELSIPVGKRKYTGLTFECQDLERFLKACLKKDEKSMNFYHDVLSHYNTYHAA
jgi:hypothetical protein